MKATTVYSNDYPSVWKEAVCFLEHADVFISSQLLEFGFSHMQGGFPL